ncbi:MAG: hypothetical protein JWQ03_1106 [Variovorax sp.]|nr:hypothetical protein [Variovorax sp.]
MILPRTVGAETLDGLAEDDPRAMRSRRDLRRVHRAMGTRTIVARALRKMMAAPRDRAAPLRLLELGAGDGTLMLGVAGALAPHWPGVELTLLDRQALVQHATLERYATLGWRASVRVADVLDWAVAPLGDRLANGGAAHWDLVVANLFLHHFEAAPLGVLLGSIAARSDHFFACEPRRAWLALVGSHLIGALGANAVTREDAVLSVHAGFTGHELSALWPREPQGWQLREHPAGLFSHCFGASRTASIWAAAATTPASRR